MVSRLESKGVREWKDLARTLKGRDRNKVNVFAQKLSQKRYALWQVGLKYLHIGSGIVRQHPHPLLCVLFPLYRPYSGTGKCFRASFKQKRVQLHAERT